MGIQNKIDNRLTGREAHEAIAVFEHDKKKILQSCSEMEDRFFFRRCARNDRYRKNDFFRLGGGIFEGGKQNPSDFASDSGKILMDGGYAEASADICIVEAAEAEILRDAKTDCAAGEENQLGDAVIFRQ